MPKYMLWPDHNCGDDLVFYPAAPQDFMLILVNLFNRNEFAVPKLVPILCTGIVCTLETCVSDVLKLE